MLQTAPMGKSPATILREHTGLQIKDFAKESNLSRQTIHSLENGKGCGGHAWRHLSNRWPLELRQLGLTADDFFHGEVRAAG